MNDENCLFCKIIEKQIPSEIIFENEQVLAFLDINPVNKGHTLVIPKRHVANIYDIDNDSLTAVISVSKTLSIQIKNAMKADGINLIMNNDPAAGQIVFHSHVHIIPRFGNDGFHHWSGTPYTEHEASATAEAIRSQISSLRS